MRPRRYELLAVVLFALALPDALHAAAQEEPGKRLDRLGDPLPENALARFGTARLRHGGLVFSVAFSPDGKTLASSSGDGTIRLWDTSNGKEKQVFSFANEQLTSVVFFKDGKSLAVGSMTGSIRTLATDTGKVKQTLTGHVQGQMKLALDPETQKLYSASWDGTLREWDAENGKEVRTLASGAGPLTALALSRDGKTVAVARQAGTGEIHIYDTEKGKELRQLPWGKGQVEALAFTADGKSLAIGGYNNTLGLYDVENGKEVLPFRSNNVFGLVKSGAFSPSGKILASAIQGPSVVLWGVTSGKELRRLEGAANGTNQIAYSPDGKIIAAACSDNTVRMWDVESGKDMHDVGGLKGPVQFLRFTGDGKTLIASDFARSLRTWEVTSGKELGQLRGAPVSNLTGWGLAADGKSVVYTGYDRSLHYWDPVTGKELRRLDNISQFAYQMTVSQDGKTIAVNENNRAIHVLSAETGKEIKQFTAGVNQNLGYLMALSPDGRRLASSGYGPMYLWDVGSGASLWKGNENPNRQMQHFVFAPDGKTLAAVVNSQVQIVEVVSGQERMHIDRPPDPQKPFTVSALAFSFDGTVLATGGYTGEITLFDVATAKEIGKLGRHQGLVNALTFSADGNLLASGGADTTAIVWDLAGFLKKGRPAVDAPQPAELGSLWRDLAGDPAKAHRAIWMMTADPKKAVEILKERLEPGAPSDAKRIAKLIADLDNDDFDTREKASEALANLPEADEALKKALEGKPSLEMRRRIETILEGRKPGTANAEQVREARAVEALELVGSPDARQLLEKLAKGPAEATLTQDAKAALDRLAQRGKK